MKTLQFNGRQLAYDIEGKGAPVLLIHGFCNDAKIWEDFKHDLLEENYRVVTIDLPGFGLSERATEPSIQYYAQAALAVIEEHNLTNTVVIGHSMGGYTALAMAELAPERLRGIGLFHSHPYADSEQKRADRQRQIEFIERHGHALYVKQLVPKLFTESHRRSRPFDIDKTIHRAARYTPAGIIDGLKAMMKRPDRSSVLAELKAPVLFIVGEEDRTVDPEDSQRQLALPAQATIHALEEVAHMGMLEARRPTQLMVRKFVDWCHN